MNDLSTLTPAELAAEIEKARDACRRGEPGAAVRLAEVASEPARRSARLAPSWAQRIDYPNDYDRRTRQATQ